MSVQNDLTTGAMLAQDLSGDDPTMPLVFIDAQVDVVFSGRVNHLPGRGRPGTHSERRRAIKAVETQSRHNSLNQGRLLLASRKEVDSVSQHVSRGKNCGGFELRQL